LSAILIFSLLLADAVYACSCKRRTEPEQYFSNASYVFVGTFEGSHFGSNHTKTIDATFSITQALKGDIKAGDLIVIRTNYHGEMCGISNWANESLGAKWVIYANRANITSACSGTRPAN